MKADGSVWAWANNASGELGFGTTNGSPISLQVVGVSDVTSLSAGRDHTNALKNDWTLWTWSSNGYGQLRRQVSLGASQLFRIQVSGLGRAVVGSAVILYTSSVKDDGSLRALGNKILGQLDQDWRRTLVATHGQRH